MNEQIKPFVVDLAATSELWIGAKGGRAALGTLQAAILDLPQAETLIALDFSTVRILTASAAREGALPIIALLLARCHLPLLVNLDESAMDEVHLAAQASKTAVACASFQENRLLDCRILGLLDLKLIETLEYVVSLGEADAKTVSSQSGEPTVVTVWNNRLVALQSLGLLTERKIGRTKFYAPLVKGMRYGR